MKMNGFDPYFKIKVPHCSFINLNFVSFHLIFGFFPISLILFST